MIIGADSVSWPPDASDKAGHWPLHKLWVTFLFFSFYLILSFQMNMVVLKYEIQTLHLFLNFCHITCLLDTTFTISCTPSSTTSFHLFTSLLVLSIHSPIRSIPVLLSLFSFLVIYQCPVFQRFFFSSLYGFLLCWRVCSLVTCMFVPLLNCFFLWSLVKLFCSLVLLINCLLFVMLVG